MGTFTLGNILPKSTFRIRRTLTTRRIPNAIGEMIWMTDVRDVLSMRVKTMPTRSINSTTPAVTVKPTKANVLRSFSRPDSWLEMYERNPGYNGRTHAAANGVSKPRTNDVPTSTNKPIFHHAHKSLTELCSSTADFTPFRRRWVV